PLSEDRVALYRHAVAGPETKTIVVYAEPFWRSDGFSGQTAGPGTAAEVTLDATPASGAPGAIASFTFGPVAERFDALDGSERHNVRSPTFAHPYVRRTARPGIGRAGELFGLGSGATRAACPLAG